MSDVKRYDAKRMMHGDIEYTEIAEDPSGRWVSILDYDSLRSLLVKACVDFAHMGISLDDIATKFNIRLRFDGNRTFEEDTTK